jgi:hypothetical protein
MAVWAVNENVRSELALAAGAEVPTDVTVCVDGAGFTTALIANHASIIWTVM